MRSSRTIPTFDFAFFAILLSDHPFSSFTRPLFFYAHMLLQERARSRKFASTILRFLSRHRFHHFCWDLRQEVNTGTWLTFLDRQFFVCSAQPSLTWCVLSTEPAAVRGSLSGPSL
jgi:hypothetical protein